jgi:hypothetical protein
MYSLDEASAELTSVQAELLKNNLAKLVGVIEAVVLAQERTIILKIDKTQEWDETQLQTQVYQLLRG